MQNNNQRPEADQGGTALIETTLGLLAVLFFAGLCLELTQTHQTRYLISLALQEAARVAAVTHANPGHWRPVLIRGLRLTYASIAAQRQHARLTQAHGLDPYYVEVLDPARVRQSQGKDVPFKPRRSGQPSEEVLHLRLSYLYVPKQPWLRTVIKVISELSATQQESHARLLKAARDSGLIPIVVEYKVLMHSDLPG